MLQKKEGRYEVYGNPISKRQTRAADQWMDMLAKKFNYDPEAVYTDYGCNNETYINGDFLEIETLGPLTKLRPGEAVEHTEYWQLTKVFADEREESIDANILPLVNSFLEK